jgi:hypothetical protein
MFSTALMNEFYNQTHSAGLHQDPCGVVDPDSLTPDPVPDSLTPGLVPDSGF